MLTGLVNQPRGLLAGLPLLPLLQQLTAVTRRCSAAAVYPAVPQPFMALLRSIRSHQQQPNSGQPSALAAKSRADHHILGSRPSVDSHL